MATGSELDPLLAEDMLLKMHRTMVLARRFDERMLTMQRQGRIGTFAPIQGQEAQVGAAAALEPGDWLVPSFREMPGELCAARAWKAFARSTEATMKAGLCGGFEQPARGHSGRKPNLACCGSGLCHQYRQEKHVAMVFFGDGATSEGDFHEAMNFAAVYQLPVIFVAQNNHWAISVRAPGRPIQRLSLKSPCLRHAGDPGRWNDVLAVYAAAREAVERPAPGVARLSLNPSPTAWPCTPPQMIPRNTARRRRWRNGSSEIPCAAAEIPCDKGC